MKIRIIASKEAEGQDSIKEYIGTEWEIINMWQDNVKRNSSKWNGLEKGEVQVILKSESDPNPRNQPSILNAGEYEFL